MDLPNRGIIIKDYSRNNVIITNYNDDGDYGLNRIVATVTNAAGDARGFIVELDIRINHPKYAATPPEVTVTPNTIYSGEALDRFLQAGNISASVSRIPGQLDSYRLHLRGQDGSPLSARETLDALRSAKDGLGEKAYNIASNIIDLATPEFMQLDPDAQRVALRHVNLAAIPAETVLEMPPRGSGSTPRNGGVSKDGPSFI